jgi:glutamine synthetase
MEALETDRAFLLEGGVFNDDLLDRWAKKKRNEDREVRNRPHPYEIELYYGL